MRVDKTAQPSDDIRKREKEMAEEKKKTEVKEEVKEEAKEAAEAVEEKAAALRSSTEAKRKKKADRREIKAARKEANKAEEKKRRPSNGLLALLIFGVLIIMFAFVGLYNFFSKPATIEDYINENGIADMYSGAQIDEYNTTLTVRGDGNTIKILFKVPEDAPEETLAQYKGDEGKDTLTNVGTSFLTSIKPETRAFGGTVKVGVRQGDETINYVTLSYKEAKKVVEEAQKEAEEDADEAGDAAENTDATKNAAETDGE